MTEPAPLSFSLPDARRRLMRAANTGTGDELDPALEEIRRRGMAEILEARWSSTVPSRFAGATWEQITDPDARAKLQAWSAMSKPTNLTILGPVGVGKTSAATVALRAAHEGCLEVHMAHVKTMLDSLKPGGPEGALDDLCSVDRLLVDDIGKEVRSAWTAEQLDFIISARYDEERPVVVTSNFNANDLEAHIGAHVADRLLGDGAVIVVMRGQSRRR